MHCTPLFFCLDVNKDIKLSDEIKNEFNHYYINIRNSNNKDIGRCTQEAKRLKKW